METKKKAGSLPATTATNLNNQGANISQKVEQVNRSTNKLVIEKSNGNLIELVESFIQDNYHLRYNTVTNSVEYRTSENEDFQPVNENNIYRTLRKNNFKISMSDLTAILGSDFVEQHDPIEEYFKTLPKWDGKDYIRQLVSYVGTSDPQRFAYHLQKHLVRTVACALDPNYFNKHAFIIVGYQQNSGKSTFIRWLVPEQLADYLNENFSTDKDGQIALSENFIINLDELATLDKADINKLKSIFSRDRVKVRHPFGRKAITTPRRASFFGSTNDSQFLTDETGSVRWLCFEISSIDWGYSSDIDVNMIWGQAFALYKKPGFKYQLNKEDILENEDRNRQFQRSNPELEAINMHYAPGNEDSIFMTAFEIGEELKIWHPSSRFSHHRIGKVLIQLGFQRDIRRHEVKGKSNPVYGYWVLRKPNI